MKTEILGRCCKMRNFYSKLFLICGFLAVPTISRAMGGEEKRVIEMGSLTILNSTTTTKIGVQVFSDPVVSKGNRNFGVPPPPLLTQSIWPPATTLNSNSKQLIQNDQYFPRKHVITQTDYNFLTNPAKSEHDRQLYLQKLVKGKELKNLDNALDNAITFAVLPSNQSDWRTAKTGVDFEVLRINGPPPKNPEGKWNAKRGFRVSKIAVPVLQLEVRKREKDGVIYDLKDFGKRFIVANAEPQKRSHDHESHLAGAIEKDPRKLDLTAGTPGLHKIIKAQRERDESRVSLATFDPNENYKIKDARRPESSKRRRREPNKNKR